MLHSNMDISIRFLRVKLVLSRTKWLFVDHTDYLESLRIYKIESTSAVRLAVAKLFLYLFWSREVCNRRKVLLSCHKVFKQDLLANYQVL